MTDRRLREVPSDFVQDLQALLRKADLQELADEIPDAGLLTSDRCHDKACMSMQTTARTRPPASCTP